VAAGGSRDALVPLDPAAAQAGDAGEDGEGKVAPGAAGARSLNNLFACIEKTPAWSKLFMAQTRALTERCKRGGAFWRAGAASTSPEQAITM
jgi:hypothetical protein